MEVQDVIRRTKEVLVTRFDLGVQAGAISDDEPIFEAGLGLDSMAAVLLPVSVLAFSRAVEKGRRDGSLMHY